MNESKTREDLRQHELVILRRLRGGPLTEFELATQISEHSGYNYDEACDLLPDWIAKLREEGLVWSGQLTNAQGQSILAAALTRVGRELAN